MFGKIIPPNGIGATGFPSTVLTSYLKIVNANINLISFTAKNLPGLEARITNVKLGAIPSMMSMPEMKILCRRVRRMVFSAFPLSFTEITESETIEYIGIRIDILIR